MSLTYIPDDIGINRIIHGGTSGGSEQRLCSSLSTDTYEKLPESAKSAIYCLNAQCPVLEDLQAQLDDLTVDELRKIDLPRIIATHIFKNHLPNILKRTGKICRRQYRKKNLRKQMGCYLRTILMLEL